MAASSFLSSFGSFFSNLLNSSQLQSIGRTAFKIGGALLVAKYGIDPSSLESVVGGVIAGGAILSSVKAHASAPASSAPSISVSDIVNTAVQSAVTSILTSLPASVALAPGSVLTTAAVAANPHPAAA